MPIKWETHTVGSFSVTHWAKHKPEEILAVASDKSNQIPRAHPPLFRNAFGSHLLAVRRFEKPNRTQATVRFEILRQMADKKVSVVETPVALITGEKENEALLVTLWKKGTRKLSDFLYDINIPLELRDRARLNAMRQIAKVHAAGFSHGHLKIGNFVVNNRGESQLIDPIMVESKPGKDTEIKSLFPRELLYCPPRSRLSSEDLQVHYRKWLEIYRRQFAKRRIRK